MTEKKSEYIALLEKMLKVSKSVGTIAKDAVNPHFKNSYSTFNNIIDKLEEYIDEQGLAVIHAGNVDEHGHSITTLVVDLETGYSTQSILPLGQNMDAQKVAGATTYFKRYNLALLFNLRFEDDDGNTASGIKKKVPKATQCPKCSEETLRSYSGKKGDISPKTKKPYAKDWKMNVCSSKECGYKESIL